MLLKQPSLVVEQEVASLPAEEGDAANLMVSEAVLSINDPLNTFLNLALVLSVTTARSQDTKSRNATNFTATQEKTSTQPTVHLSPRQHMILGAFTPSTRTPVRQGT